MLLRKLGSLIAICLIFAMTMVGCGSSNTAESTAASKAVIEEIAVTLEGGSGRATITSPAKVTTTESGYELQIEWSSSNYDYMIYEGEKYLPTNTEGNSTFVLPVKSFDQPIAVIADTIAMSKPHEIEYQIVFGETKYAAGTSGNNQGSFDLKTMWIFPVIGAAFGIFLGRKISAGKRAELAAAKAKQQEMANKKRSSTYTKKRKSKKR